jgi:hypothetical protein
MPDPGESQVTSGPIADHSIPGIHRAGTEWKPNQAVERVEPGSVPASQGMGSEMPARADAITKPGRPFTGFEREQATYERRKPELLKVAEGKFVVLVGGELIGPFETEDEAERAGYSRFGLGPLYIRQVLAEERAIILSRDVAPCRI